MHACMHDSQGARGIDPSAVNAHACSVMVCAAAAEPALFCVLEQGHVGVFRRIGWTQMSDRRFSAE